MKKVLKQIVRNCADKKIQIDEDFLQYYCELLLLNPEWNLENTENIQNFTEFIVTKLLSSSYDLIIIQMQFFFTSKFDNIDKIVERNRKDLEDKLKSLHDDIVVTTNFPDQSSGIQMIYKKVVYYIALMSGLGNPSVDEVFKETLCALKSILNESELRQFVEDENQSNKDQQLQELIKLVTGIRLFNKDCKKGGEGIQDLPQLLQKAIQTCLSDTQETLYWVMDCVNLLTTALDMIYVTKQDQDHIYIECNLSDDLTEEILENMKVFLLAFRQYEVYLRKLIDEIKQLEEHINVLISDNFEDILLDIHKTVNNRVAIPVVQVFPKFTKLADTWYSLQNQNVRFVKFVNILNGLKEYIEVLDFDPDLAEKILKGSPPKTDAKRLLNPYGQELIGINKKIEIIKPKYVQNVDKIDIQYLGFCAWKLVETQGALITGNPNFGIIRFMDMNFVFSSIDGGIEFGKCPEKYIQDAIRLARKRPELINFLQLRSQLKLFDQITALITESLSEKVFQDCEVQTVTHPIVENLDRTYKWNIWEWKRDALRTANYMRCKTISAQTAKTYGRFSAIAQTHTLKNQICQTKRDNYTNVPKVQNFIYGLRGRKDDKQFIIDLTRPVEE